MISPGHLLVSLMKLWLDLEAQRSQLSFYFVCRLWRVLPYSHEIPSAFRFLLFHLSSFHSFHWKGHFVFPVMAVLMSLFVPHLKILRMDPGMGLWMGLLVDVPKAHLPMTFLRDLLLEGSPHQQGKDLEPVPTTFARGRKFQGFACAPPRPNQSWLLSEEHSVCRDHRNTLKGILLFVFVHHLT